MISDVELELGPLETPDDAERQLRQLVLWGAAGLVPGTIVNGCVHGLEVWLKAFAEQMDLERVRELEGELKRARAGR